MKDPAAMKSAMAAASAMGQGSGPEARRPRRQRKELKPFAFSSPCFTFFLPPFTGPSQLRQIS